MKALLLFLMFAPLSNVFAQEWTYLTTSTDGKDYFYKNHTEDILYKKIWIKVVGKKLSRYSRSNKKVYFSGHSLMLYNVNCSDRSSAIIKVSHYSSNGTFLDSSNGNEFAFSYPNPGTIGESIVEAACDQ
jgi:hypothetical protein